MSFQLAQSIGWTTISTTALAVNINFGFTKISNDIDKSFGLEVSDLPLESYCAQIVSDITIISSNLPLTQEHYPEAFENKPSQELGTI